MFSPAEKQTTSSFVDKTQELGSLGLSVDDFKSVLATLKRRSECLLLADPLTPLRGLVTDRTTQNSLLSLLGTKKKTESGGATSEVKKSAYNNLKNKIDAEEAAIKTVFEIMASTPPSKDNPLKDDDKVIISTDPWSAPTEKLLEYLFREGVSLDVDYTNVRFGRYLGGEDTGDCPFVLTVKCQIRILQCLLLNFSWFGNRLYRVMKNLNVESKASSTGIVFHDAPNRGWADMMVRHCIRENNVPAALEFVRAEYPVVYSKIRKSGKKPTYFAVEFELVDNAVGLPNSDTEHQGTACVEWKCFNKDFNSQPWRIDNNALLGGGGGASFEEAAETESDGDGQGAIAPSAADNPSWSKSIMELDIGSGESNKYEKFRSGTLTATVNQTSSVSLVAMAKGNESKALVDAMIKFIDETIKAIDEPYMYSGDYVFPEDQRENYHLHKDVYLAAICSNPSNIYRVACQLFTNLVLPRLRNPVRDSRRTTNQPIGNGRSKVIIEYGYGDVQYGTPQYAKGKVRVSARRSCECRKMCKEPRCFDSNRQINTLKNGGSDPDPAERRYHNSHRSNAYDFRFFDKIEDGVRQLSNKKKTADEEYITNHDFLAHDTKAFDLLSKCFLSAGLHHIYCPDVLMIHRGDNFNIDLRNNKFDCVTVTANQSEQVTSSQTVNAKEALTDITRNRLRKGADIVEHVRSSGLSLREFSSKTSRVVRNMNELTSNLCNTTFSCLNPMRAINAVVMYINMLMPTLETILSFLNIEQLQKPFDELKACTTPEAGHITPVTKKSLKASFNLFRAVSKFLLRNYNASVAAAINRRGYLSNIATLTGYRFQYDGNTIYYHESIAAVSSCIAYADYFSYRSAAGGEHSEENGMVNIDGTVASLMDDSSSGRGDDSETFMKMFAGELLGGDETEDEEDEENPKSPAMKRSLSDSSSDEEQDRAEKRRRKTEEEEENKQEQIF